MKAAARIQSLEVLRGLAALAVAWFHITHGGKLLADATNPLLQLASGVGAIGYHGITLFFVLSGFVIPWSMRHAPHVRGLQGAIASLPMFLIRRLLRLQPPYLAACLLALLLNGLASLAPGYQGQPVASLPQSLIAQQTDTLYITGLLGGTWILVVAWTLALEVQFYVVAGLIEPLASPARRSTSSPWAYGLGVAAVSALAVLIPQGTLIFRVLPQFGLGWVMAHQAQRPQMVHGLAIAWLLGLLANLSGFEQAMVAALCAALIHIALAVPSFAPPPFGWLGAISYSLFLVHVPIGGRVVNLCSRFAPTPMPQLFICLLALLMFLVVAWGFWASIERPSQQWSRRLLAPS